MLKRFRRFEPNAAQPNDSTNPQLEYGPSNFNIPHRFTWNFAYEFPKMGGDWQRLKNGWGINSILSLQNGQPFQLVGNVGISRALGKRLYVPA